jgi:hypothetical protein
MSFSSLKQSAGDAARSIAFVSWKDTTVPCVPERDDAEAFQGV